MKFQSFSFVTAPFTDREISDDQRRGFHPVRSPFAYLNSFDIRQRLAKFVNVSEILWNISNCLLGQTEFDVANCAVNVFAIAV